MLLFISILLLSSFPSITSACSCAELPSVEEEFERSQAVFSGKVVDVREKRSIKGYQTKSVLFEVTNTWKGVKQSQIIVTTGQGGGDCGFNFKKDKNIWSMLTSQQCTGESHLYPLFVIKNQNNLSVLQEDLKYWGRDSRRLKMLI